MIQKRALLITLIAACGARSSPPTAKTGAEARVAELPNIRSVAPSEWVTVYVSPGAEARALVLRDLVNGAVDHWKQHVGGGEHVVIAVLDREHWKVASSDHPYGFPHGERGRPWVLFLPSVPEESVIAAAMIPLIGREHAAIMVDNIAAHELGHVIATERLYGPDPKPPVRWFNELVATYFAYGYLRDAHRDRAAIWDEATERTLAGPRPAHTSLVDFEQQIADPTNYNWYELAFSREVKVVYDGMGDGFVDEMRAKLPWTTQGSWTSAELVDRLDSLAHGMKTWAASL